MLCRADFEDCHLVKEEFILKTSVAWKSFSGFQVLGAQTGKLKDLIELLFYFCLIMSCIKKAQLKLTDHTPDKSN